ncbi:magnesium transporter CorA family protein [Candidatus Peregrinibacteria bacterium]|nr:magnesium transporter CorA family protein [Candidatus Peregrinibacteria bacterium]
MREITHQGIAWLDYPSPTEKELRALQQKYHFHDLDIEDCLSEHERPKIEEYENYLFLVFHIPYLAKDSERILKEEVNIFFGQDFLITIHNDKIPLMEVLWQHIAEYNEKKVEFLSQGTGYFLYELMQRLFDEGFPLVDTIRKKLRAIEEELFDTEEEERIGVHRDILSVKRNIITMRSIIQPQRTLVALLEHKNKKFIPPDLGIYFDNILDAIERQWALLETSKEMSDALHETHESVLSHRTNAVIRALAVLNVITLFPLFITGFYGMNVHLPYAESPYAFVGLAGVIISIFLGTLWFFSRKRWL